MCRIVTQYWSVKGYYFDFMALVKSVDPLDLSSGALRFKNSYTMVWNQFFKNQPNKYQ